MYLIKQQEKLNIINQSELARIVGINISTMSRIFNKKQNCSKVIAYAITKAINQNAEIEDFFEKVK